MKDIHQLKVVHLVQASFLQTSYKFFIFLIL